MNKATFTQRREKLRKLMFENNIDALLVSCPTNRYYLSGFELRNGQCNETSGFIIVTKDGKDLLCTDPRFDLAATEVWDSENVHIYSGSLSDFYNNLLKSLPYTNYGFDEEQLNYNFVQKAFEGINHIPAHGLVEQLRVIKDEEEVKLMRATMALNQNLMRHLPSYFEDNIHKAITENDVAWYIEQYFRSHGASENAFDPIVALNQHAALPHCIPSETVLTENSLILIDVGARLNDYNSDQTRTFWIGDKPSDRFKTVLEQVQGAQQAALDIIKPGITGKQAYEASYNFFKKYGVEKAFTHNLGHGIGLETHEAPRLSPLSDTVLEKNMLVTVEPGLYYKEWGGIRWEYTVLITDDGCEIL